MKTIPDFDAERAQVIEYILSSDLAKKAMMNPPFRDYTNILIAIIEQ